MTGTTYPSELFPAMDNDASGAAADEYGHALLRRRRSIRSYQTKPVARAALERMFQSVAQAPSAHNRQPWRFLIITAADLKAKLASAMGPAGNAISLRAASALSSSFTADCSCTVRWAKSRMAGKGRP